MQSSSSFTRSAKQTLIEAGKVPEKLEVCLLLDMRPNILFSRRFLDPAAPLSSVQKARDQCVTFKIQNCKWKDSFWEERRTLSIETIGKVEKGGE